MTRAALVLGGGVAGVQAALDLADAGYLVHLVERSPSLGGNMIRLDKTFPTNDCSACILSPRLVEAGRHPRIHLLTNSDLVSLEGEAGAFTARVVERPRYVDASACVGCGACSEVCPVRVPSEFDLGLSKRRAIYIPFPQAVPLKYVIDPAHCLKLTKGKCGLCARACQAGAVDYDARPVEHVLDVGAVVVATGFQQLDASRRPELGHGRFRDVVTGLELERMLSASGPTGGKVLRPSDGAVPARVAFVHCALSRDVRRGVAHCSRVCCMYLVKEAMVLREHHPEAGATLLHMDLRAFGKGYDAYVDRAQASGIAFVRGRATEVQEDGHGGLMVLAEDEEGRPVRVGADLVVLGTAIVPAQGADGLAGALGLGLDAAGFLAVDPDDPAALRTTRPGVLVAGCASGPRDVPDSVAQGSAAAAAAAGLLRDHRMPVPPPEVPVTDPTAEPRVGVFVCHCGSNIAGVVDTKAVAGAARALPGVVHAEENVYTCSQDAQSGMARTIRDQGLNRVVVAACSPTTHEPLFRSTLVAAGLDPHLLDMANIRNQCSWAHSREPEAATEKAVDLVRASVARARTLEPLGSGVAEVAPRALVVGGGVAGMAAALALAPHVEVTLVERADRLGGTVRLLSTTFPDGEAGSDIVDRLERAVRAAGVRVLTGARVEALGGHVGGFTYALFTPDGRLEGTAGAVVMAVGASPYEPAKGEHGRGHPAVVTNLELEEELRERPEGRAYAFVQCVGSRADGRGCSRYCCQATLQQARELAEAGNRVVVLHRDVRAYAARGEGAYSAAREAGVLFARYAPERPPEVRDAGWGKALVRWRDPLAHRTVERRVDRVVLAVGLRPPEGLAELRAMLKLPGDLEGFLLERHPKLGPVETSTEGIYLAGACQYPMSIPEAAAAGAAAAMKALGPLGRGWVPTEAGTAEVDRDACIGCSLCARLCPYGAISKDAENRAVVAAALCKACGLCGASCPVRAISVRHFRDGQLVAQVRALAGEGGGAP